MRFYHIDRDKTLKSGLLLPYATPKCHPAYSLFPTISQHGVHYLLHDVSKYVRNEYGENKLVLDPDTLLNEWMLEYVRATIFPQIPSRFQCIFASKSIELLKNWINYWNIQDCNIAEIEAEKYFELDATWYTSFKKIEQNLNSLTTFKQFITRYSSVPMLEAAQRYWKGELSTHPQLEVLIPLPCQVIKVESYSIR